MEPTAKTPRLDTPQIPAAETTLVKYNNPILVSVHEKKVKKSGAPDGGAIHSQYAPNAAVALNAGACGDAGSSKKETEEILNLILPPIEFKVPNANIWRQMVSSVPATRMDVINLEEQLNMRLKQRQARETGICPIRRELYSQCFDELIRQVTINCAERGLLLPRVRDEIRMTLAAYRSLYESSTAYGMRKALMAESGETELETKIVEISAEKDDLDTTATELKNKMEELERKFSEQRENEEKKHALAAAAVVANCPEIMDCLIGLQSDRNPLAMVVEVIMEHPSISAVVALSACAWVGIAYCIGYFGKPRPPPDSKDE